jgi:hypothetical protein
MKLIWLINDNEGKMYTILEAILHILKFLFIFLLTYATEPIAVRCKFNICNIHIQKMQVKLTDNDNEFTEFDFSAVLHDSVSICSLDSYR